MQIVESYEWHFEFLCEKKNEKKVKILSSKPILQVEEIVPLKSLFELSRYLKRLPRYKDSKFPWCLKLAQKLWMGPRVTDLHFFVEMRTMFFQEFRLSLVCSLG